MPGNFGDILNTLALASGQSFRRNAADNGFEAYTFWAPTGPTGPIGATGPAGAAGGGVGGGGQSGPTGPIRAGGIIFKVNNTNNLSPSTSYIKEPELNFYGSSGQAFAFRANLHFFKEADSGATKIGLKMTASGSDTLTLQMFNLRVQWSNAIGGTTQGTTTFLTNTETALPMASTAALATATLDGSIWFSNSGSVGFSFNNASGATIYMISGSWLRVEEINYSLSGLPLPFQPVGGGPF